jgi:hypothetical protein
MDLMVYWRWDNYNQDVDERIAFNCCFNSNQSRLHSGIELGERLWLVTGQKEKQRVVRYLLLAQLTIIEKTHNLPGYKYGQYRLRADPKRSSYYRPGPDISSLLLRLDFNPYSPIESENKIGQSLQTIRGLSDHDKTRLITWASKLDILNVG